MTQSLFILKFYGTSIKLYNRHTLYIRVFTYFPTALSNIAIGSRFYQVNIMKCALFILSATCDLRDALEDTNSSVFIVFFHLRNACWQKFNFHILAFFLQIRKSLLAELSSITWWSFNTFRKCLTIVKKLKKIYLSIAEV